MAPRPTKPSGTFQAAGPPAAHDGRDPHWHFIATVARSLTQYARRVLPANILARARRMRPPQTVVDRVRFCVECDASGVPLQPEPLRQVELWCDLLGWGRVHVGQIPVPYDPEYCCSFPPIVDAVLHFVPAGAPPPPTAHDPPGRALLPWAVEGGCGMRMHARHVVSLQLAEEPRIVEAVNAMLHKAGKWAAATTARSE